MNYTVRVLTLAEKKKKKINTLNLLRTSRGHQWYLTSSQWFDRDV